MPKSIIRFNRQPKGTRAKVNRIVKDLASGDPRKAPPQGSSGAKIFAVWAEGRR